VYTSGLINKINWENKTEGVKDIHSGLLFASGTNIIMSKDIVEKIIRNKNHLEYDTVDDVSIGNYIRNYLPVVYNDLKLNYKTKIYKKSYLTMKCENKTSKSGMELFFKKSKEIKQDKTIMNKTIFIRNK
jgi:hypothetical protein